jgi:hypothetical protein
MAIKAPEVVMATKSLVASGDPVHAVKMAGAVLPSDALPLPHAVRARTAIPRAAAAFTMPFWARRTSTQKLTPELPNWFPLRLKTVANPVIGDSLASTYVVGMNEGVVSPETLLDQLRAAVEVVAAASQDQLAWCLNGRISFPVDEIPQSFEQVAFTHRPRLRESALLSAQADGRIDDLLAYFAHMRALGRPGLWQHEGLDEPEWEVARSKASQVLEVL